LYHFADDMELWGSQLSELKKFQKYQTPNLDQLASEGMRFTDATVSSSICSPS